MKKPRTVLYKIFSVCPQCHETYYYYNLVYPESKVAGGQPLGQANRVCDKCFKSNQEVRIAKDKGE